MYTIKIIEVCQNNEFGVEETFDVVTENEYGVVKLLTQNSFFGATSCMRHSALVSFLAHRSDFSLTFVNDKFYL